jgi:hypothetical protein
MAAPRFKDHAKNAFVKTNLFYTKNVFLGIQDPTVFGFKLLFHFDTPNSPLLYGATRDINKAPLNTAANYLKSIGDEQRLYYLSKFVYLLSNINSQTPWYFQTLSGLKEAWKHDYTKPYIGDDKKLEIECAESIDLRITALMDYYRKACFDWKYRREVVPKNLRQFKLSIFVYEARFFNNPNSIAVSPPDVPVDSGYGGNIQGQAAITNAELVERLTGKDETANDPITENVNTVLGVPMSTTRNLFHFDFCEFDMNEGSHLDGLNNTEPVEVKQKFGITYGDFEETNMYNFWDRNYVSDGFITSLDKLALDDPNPGVPPTQSQKPPIAPADTSLKGSVNELKEQAEARADKIKKDANTKLDNISGESVEAALATRLKKKAESLVAGLFMGNVYGFSAGSLTGAGGAQSLASKALDAGTSLLNQTKGSAAGENIFEGSNPTNVTGKPPVDNTSYGPSLTNKDKPSSPNTNIYE